MLTTYLTYYL